MSDRFRHKGHVLRVAGLFACGLVGFLVIRHALIPSDFGKFGFYRAGALDDARAHPVVYAGHETCEVCHSAVVEARANSKHKILNCEACHGPLAKHASGDDPNKPKEPDSKVLCLRCHLKMPGKYEGFPQVSPADHPTDAPCIVCHKPHSPKIQ